MTDLFEAQRNGYAISTDKTKLDVDAIHAYLSERSYWAEGRPREVMEKAIANSLCFGVYDGERQAGFARVVTDYATFAWMCDVFILEDYRGARVGQMAGGNGDDAPDLGETPAHPPGDVRRA